LQDDNRQRRQPRRDREGARRSTARPKSPRTQGARLELPPFEIPAEIYAAWDARAKGAELEAAWNNKLAAYANAEPKLAAEFKRRIQGELPADWSAQVGAIVDKINNKKETIATRKASQNAIEALAAILPELIGGSADLAGSNLTLWSNAKAVTKASGGNYLYYGVREFAMSAIVNGLALHGGLIPYGATFLTFSDYARNALRLAALSKIRSLFVHPRLHRSGGTARPISLSSTWRACATFAQPRCLATFAIRWSRR
jgi:transketolase